LGLGSLIGQPLAEIERAVIEATIRAEGGSIPLAARVLDVAPSTIYRKRDAWAKLGNRIAP
jgi:DNA-binding NtrC family response regulator